MYLRNPIKEDAQKIAILYERSVSLHRPWVYPPSDYLEYLSQENRYLLCFDESDDIAGTFHLSGITKGYFHSAYLGFEVFSPYNNKGYMREGIQLLLNEAFTKLNLHRLEANIQPDNLASIKLVSGAGFEKEGFSKSYLNIGGQGWKDHERWAIINNNWR